MLSDLEALFTSAARVQILRLFLLNPGSRFYQREVERETGQPIRAVQREVKRLEDIDLLRREEDGNKVYYQVNAAHPLVPELVALFARACGPRERPAVSGRVVLASEGERTRQESFPWLETVGTEPLPAALRRRQVGGEWDRSY